MTANVKHVHERFFINTNSDDAELLYTLDEKRKIMSIYHTFVPETERGKGLAEILAIKAFDFAKEKGFLIRPDCDYIKHFITKHKELEKMITYEK
ncbi:MAG: GNAT family N-acetyltransferase [Candidatus Micrarchaeia archaeon]